MENKRISETTQRERIECPSVKRVSDHVLRKTYDALNKKGYGSWKSRHEIMGIVTEEYDELIKAVRSESEDRVKSELYDIAVACVFAIACIEQGNLDW
jgi:NTP pyrophosphatase (non-canonical NTP hydrolase)